MPKYYIIAGESSGDLHASNLIRALKRVDLSSTFRGFGGDKMAEQGLEVVKHIKELDFMGFLEVVVNLRTILSQISDCRKDIAAWKPDAVILIDYPGFNLRIASAAKKMGITVFYYISPQIWAWKKGRIRQIKKNVDKMFVILPFEKKFYAKYGYKAEYVGHPLLDELKRNKSDIDSDKKEIKKPQESIPVVAILPGSRVQEVKRILPVMAKVAGEYKYQYKFVLAAVRKIPQAIYHNSIKDSGIEVVVGNTYSVLKKADVALVASGTATLETALFNVPQVVCYKASGISYRIAKNLVSLKYISLVNLILNKNAVTELIQSEMNAANLKKELFKIINDKNRVTEMLADYERLKKMLGQQGASETTANSIYNAICT